MNPLDQRSITRMKGVHPDLVHVITVASMGFQREHPGLSFFVTEGVRTRERQRELVSKGASRTMNSRHIPGADGLGKAIDLAVKLDGELRWDWPLYAKLGATVKRVAREQGIPVEWGGDWRSFRDGPHFQLNARRYP
jgi:peptidoglycan LD-endopeptidase CwlK